MINIRRVPAILHILLIYQYYSFRGWLSILAVKIIYGSQVSFSSSPKLWGSIVVKILGSGFLKVGKNSHLVSESKRSFITLYSKIQLTVYSGGKIILGDNVALNGTVITSKKSVSIGSGTMIAPNVIIVDSDFHQTWPPESRFISDTTPFDEEVKIGKNVWIGMNSLILKGSVIGDNSIIAAGSVVTGEIPSNCMAAGSPAKPIKFLNE